MGASRGTIGDDNVQAHENDSWKGLYALPASFAPVSSLDCAWFALFRAYYPDFVTSRQDCSPRLLAVGVRQVALRFLLGIFELQSQEAD